MNHLIAADVCDVVKPRSGGAGFSKYQEPLREPCLCLGLPKGKCRRFAASFIEKLGEKTPTEAALLQALPSIRQGDRARLLFVQLHARHPVTDGFLELLAEHFAWLAVVPNGCKVYGVGLLHDFEPDDDSGSISIPRRLQDLVAGCKRPFRRVQGRDCAMVLVSIVSRWRVALFHASRRSTYGKGVVGELLAQLVVTDEERDVYCAEAKARSTARRIARRRRENEARRQRRHARREAREHVCSCGADIAMSPKGPTPKCCAKCRKKQRNEQQKRRRWIAASPTSGYLPGVDAPRLPSSAGRSMCSSVAATVGEPDGGGLGRRPPFCFSAVRS
jgi:hypothetical protein